MSLAFVLCLALTQTPVQENSTPLAVVPDAAKVEVNAPVAESAVKPQTEWWQRFTLSGFARIGVFYTFPLQDDQLVGSNGGFRVADFRLGLAFHPVDKLTIDASVELAAPLVDALDPLTGRRIVDVRDAFVQYDIAKFLQVRAGQFRPPFYAEMLQSDASIPFISRSVIATGFNPPEAYGPRSGLAPDRQVGLQLGSARLGEVIGFKYAVGVFNGNGLNQLFNDNNGVMPVARVEIDLLKRLTLGINGFYNQRTEGVRPNRLTTNQLGYGADISASCWGLSALVAFLGRSSTYGFAGLPPDSSLGFLGQLRYFHEATGLEVAARFAYFEPSVAQPDDQVMEVAGMVGWKPFDLPFRVLLQYTHRNEEARATYSNDSVDLMLHAVW